MKRRSKLAQRATLALLAVFAPAVAQAADEQFNLTCKGTVRTLAPAILQDETKSYEDVYRINVAARKWCAAECTGGQADLIEVSPVVLVLEEKNIDTPREHDVIKNRISRETSAHSAMAESGIGRMRLAMFWKGQCEKSEFTGFPKVAAKF